MPMSSKRRRPDAEKKGGKAGGGMKSIKGGIKAPETN